MLKGKLGALTRTLVIPTLGAATIAACSSADLPSTPTVTPFTGARPEQAISPAGPEWAAMTPQSREEWRKTMSRTPFPKSEGCFRVSHPSTQWVEIPCTPAPAEPLPSFTGDEPVHAGHGAVSPSPRVTKRSAEIVAPDQVGNTFADYASQVSGLISQAEGSFPSVTGLTTENDVQTGVANSYSLQLNTNRINSATGNTEILCSGAANPSTCTGWEQFFYSSVSYGAVFIQYWLLNYGNSCPGGWSSSANNCYKNSSTIAVPLQPITNLANLTLEGAAGASDTLKFSTGDGTFYGGSWPTVLTLDGAWTIAEFNIFGDMSSTTASLNSGTTVFVQTSTQSFPATIGGPAPTAAPSCWLGSFTAETNTLNLNRSSTSNNDCCAFGGSSPGIVFWEASTSLNKPLCQYAASLSDVAGEGNVTMQCTYDTTSDPINIYEKVSGVWQLLYTYDPIYSAAGFTGNVGATSVSETPGSPVTLLGCSGPTPPSQYAACGYPVAPGDDGCDQAATSLCFPQTVAACLPSQCGTSISDLCGGTINCPACCQPQTCQPGMCGKQPNGNNCGVPLDCGPDCASGEVCVSGSCESSDPCPNGVWFDGKCFRGPGGGAGGGGQSI